jgi:hypothetical protein
MQQAKVHMSSQEAQKAHCWLIGEVPAFGIPNKKDHS